jgi:anti-anti-sigma factor
MAADIRYDDESGACVFAIEGDIDAANVPEIREELDSAMERGCINVVLDLARVTYADSSALGLLVWLDRRLGPLQGRLVLAGASRDVNRILQLSGLVQVASTVATSPNVSAALEGLDLPAIPRDSLWARDIVMPARVEELAAVREEACELISGLTFGEAALFDIKVALGEALANAVRHGSPNGAASEVRIRVEAYDDRVMIRVSDSGCGFDGEHSCSEDVYASGGRGIMFMRALMDRVDFEASPQGGTVVTLVKHRAGVEAA